MQKEQFEVFEEWFAGYIAGFHGDDEYINANLKLKEDHTYAVCDEMEYLAGRLGIEQNDCLTARTIALFHDVGRFEQFVKYRTYNDRKSENHCALALTVLEQHGVLNELDERQRRIIQTAIRFHGKKKLPVDLDPETALFTKLIRDADKIDVYRVLIDSYKKYKADPDQFNLEIEFPDEPHYSSHMIEAIKKGRLIDYGELRTLNDMKLLQLGWVFDINFAETLLRIQKRGFLEQIVAFLPRTDDIAMVAECVFDYVASRLEQVL
ncbi:MAG: HD domain-containing protein [Planctomycetota bacterium]